MVRTAGQRRVEVEGTARGKAAGAAAAGDGGAVRRQGRQQGAARKAAATQDKRSARTRGAIVAAAESEFAREGLSGARTDAIAKAAGVNKAMLYYHFESKQALYEAVVVDHFREFSGQAMAVLKAEGPAGAVLMRYVEMHFDFISGRRRYASLYQQLMMGGDGLIERIAREYFLPRAAAVERLLERGERSGEFRKTDREHTAISIAALIVFYFSNSRVIELMRQGDDLFSAENLRKRKLEVMGFIRHALFARPEGALK